MVLLDSHVWSWSLLSPERIPSAARRAITTQSDVFISMMSVYELQFKATRGRLPGFPHWSEFMAETDKIGFSIVFNGRKTVDTAARLDWSHGDPFDRLIAAEAITRGIPLATADAAMNDCPDLKILWN